MKTNRYAALISACMISILAFQANATDRVHAGQWKSTTTMLGHSSTSSTCMSQSDADALNGDEKSIRAVSEKGFAIAHCKVTGVKVNGNHVIVTAACDGTPVVSTSDYQGDSYVATTVTQGHGVTIRSKRMGACT